MYEYNYPREEIKMIKEGLQFENWTNKNDQGDNSNWPNEWIQLSKRTNQKGKRRITIWELNK